jgi:hypothetical protein
MGSTSQLADSAGDIVVPFLKRRKVYRSARESTACVRALALIGSLEAAQVIAEYASDSSFSVMKEVVRSAERFEPPIFLDVIAVHIDPTHIPGDAVAHLLLRFGRSQVPGLQRAENLRLSGITVGSQQFAITSLPNLKHLELIGPSFSDLGPVASAGHLQSLTLQHTAVYDFTPLRGLERLKRLSIYWNNSLFEPLGIGDLVGLEDLSLWSNDEIDTTAISGLIGLKRLNFGSGEVKDLAPLHNLPRIESLSFYSSRIRDLSPIGEIRSLRHLYLLGVSGGVLGGLAGLSNLTSIEIYSMDVKDLSPLATLPNLERLDLKRCDLRNDQIGALREARPNTRITVKR